MRRSHHVAVNMEDQERKPDPERFWAPLAIEYGKYSPLIAGSIDGTDDRPHDRAVERAMRAKYKCNKQVRGDPEATVFVAHVSPSTNEDTLMEVFSKYGKIRSCRMVRDIVTGRSKGYAFVEYKHKRDAEEAYHRAHHMMVDDTQIVVEWEVERVLPGWIPRRLGGGFGGKKESGQLRFGGRERPFRKPIVLGSNLLGGRYVRGGGGGEWQSLGRRREWKRRDDQRRGEEGFSRHRARSRSPRRQH